MHQMSGELKLLRKPLSIQQNRLKLSTKSSNKLINHLKTSKLNLWGYDSFVSGDQIRKLIYGSSMKNKLY